MVEKCANAKSLSGLGFEALCCVFVFEESFYSAFLLFQSLCWGFTRFGQTMALRHKQPLLFLIVYQFEIFIGHSLTLSQLSSGEQITNDPFFFQPSSLHCNTAFSSRCYSNPSKQPYSICPNITYTKPQNQADGCR